MPDPHLRTLKPDYKAILKNKKIIAVNQDPLGIQGRRIYKQKGIEIWARPIMPAYRAKYSYAIVFLNRRTDGTPSEISVTLKELGLDNPSGSVVIIRCDIVKGKGSSNLNRPGFEAAPRQQEGYVLDLGNIGFRGSVDANGFPVGQYPEIRGTGYVESNDPVQVGGGAPQQRVFRNSQAATPAPSYGVSPSYQASQYEEQLYNFQNFNGQYYGANGKK